MKLKSSLLCPLTNLLFQDSGDKPLPLPEHLSTVSDILESKEQAPFKVKIAAHVPLPLASNYINLKLAKCSMNLNCMAERVKSNTDLGIKLASMFIKQSSAVT